MPWRVVGKTTKRRLNMTPTPSGTMPSTDWMAMVAGDGGGDTWPKGVARRRAAVAKRWATAARMVGGGSYTTAGGGSGNAAAAARAQLRPAGRAPFR
ncbi:Os04g0651350, partial [Oryza sativa Japonica Group]